MVLSQLPCVATLHCVDPCCVDFCVDLAAGVGGQADEQLPGVGGHPAPANWRRLEWGDTLAERFWRKVEWERLTFEMQEGIG